MYTAFLVTLRLKNPEIVEKRINQQVIEEQFRKNHGGVSRLPSLIKRMFVSSTNYECLEERSINWIVLIIIIYCFASHKSIVYVASVLSFGQRLTERRVIDS